MANNTLEAPDNMDDLGKIYLKILFGAGIVWAFLAILNYNDTETVKLALIYMILLIFGLFGITLDRLKDDLGFDSLVWDRKNIKRQLLIAIIFSAGWYLLFMKNGNFLATSQSVGVAFTTNPTVNYFLTAVLQPLTENIFFFGVIFMTLVYLIKKSILSTRKAIVLGGLMMASYILMPDVPNILIIISVSVGLILLSAINKNKNKLIQKYAPTLAAALYVGSALFPYFHSYAYQLKQSNYIAAEYFGFFASVLAGFVGMLPADLAHIINNAIAAL